MSGPGWQQVQQFDSGPLRGAAAAWRRLADRVEHCATALTPLLRNAESAWEGSAARLATHRLRQLRDTVDAACLPLRVHARALGDLADAGERLRDHARTLVAHSADAGLWITPEGSVVPAGVSAEFAGRAVAAMQHQVREVLAEAARVDAEAARLITEQPPPAPGWWHTFAPRRHIPAPGTDPAAVHRWWRGLDPAQQALLRLRHPELIGALDGVPVAVRDRANGALLHQRREEVANDVAELERQLHALRAQPRPPGGWPGERELARALEHAAGLLATLELIGQLRARRPPVGQRAYLMAFDPAGDGRAVVAIGNPDHAHHVITYVPGVGSALSNAGRGIRRSETMAEDAARAAPEQDTASVYWLGYDAPDSLLPAASRGAATAAAEVLRRYGDGLRATHTGDGARHTVLGHSYGSTVVGQTAVDGLAADTLVFVGSPGVVAESATDLRIDGDPTEDVWASTAVGDWIHAARPTGPAGILLAPPGQRLSSQLPSSMIHGTDPSSSAFGGQTFPADPFRGHSGYWEDGNVARDHIAQITTGR